jgi:hypothetical protein
MASHTIPKGPRAYVLVEAAGRPFPEGVRARPLGPPPVGGSPHSGAMPTHHVPKSGERPDVEVLGGERVVPGRTAHVDPGRRRRVVRAGAVPATGRPLTGDWSVPGRGCPRGLHRPLTRAALNGPRASWWPARSGSTFGAARPGATGVGSRYGALGQAVTMAWGPCHGLTAAWAAIKLADPGIARPGPCHGCMRQIPHATRGRVPVSVRTPSNVSTLPIRLLGSTGRAAGRSLSP